MTTATEVKLLTLLNVSAIKRPREGEKPGGFRSPTVSRQQSVDGEAAAPTPSKRRRSVVFGGELGPSGSTYGQNGKKAKGKGKASAEPVASAAEDDDAAPATSADADAELEADSDDEAANDDDTFNTHFGAAPTVLTPAAVAAEAEHKWVTSRTSLRGLGRVVEQRVGEASDGKARVSLLLRSQLTPAHARYRRRHGLQAVGQHVPLPAGGLHRPVRAQPGRRGGRIRKGRRQGEAPRRAARRRGSARDQPCLEDEAAHRAEQ